MMRKLRYKSELNVPASKRVDKTKQAKARIIRRNESIRCNKPDQIQVGARFQVLTTKSLSELPSTEISMSKIFTCKGLLSQLKLFSNCKHQKTKRVFEGLKKVKNGHGGKKSKRGFLGSPSVGS